MSSPKQVKVKSQKDIKVKVGDKEVDATLVEVEHPKDDRPDTPDVPEEGADYLAIAESFLATKAGQFCSDGINMPDTSYRLEDFQARDGHTIAQLEEHIRTNNLEDAKGWRVAADLIKALRAYAEAHP